jgi:cytochrome c553
MQRFLKRARVLIFLLGFIGGAGLLVKVTPGHAQGAKDKTGYPRLSDLMNEAMQVHHTKLWFAGNAHNWPLAGYEVRKIKETILEIKETIVEIQTASSAWRQVPVGELLTNLDSSVGSLEQAVKAKDPAKFNTAYSQLTATCNACHTAAGQQQVKIIVPLANASGAFLDQDFTSGGGAAH